MPKFRLSTVILLMLCFGLFCGWFSERARSRRLDLKLYQLKQKHEGKNGAIYEMQTLSFDAMRVGAKELKLIRRHKRIRQLILRGSHVTPATLSEIAKMKHFESLHLESNHSLTDESLACLIELPNLRELDLTNCNGITTSAFRHLAEIETLERIRLDPSMKGLPEIDGLRASLPNCVVTFDHSHKIRASFRTCFR